MRASVAIVEDQAIASSLWQRIRAHDAATGVALSTLAIMGMTKNTGKTVALNHVLAQAAASNVRVGVTSIGRDGEDHDQVYMVPKPPVLVWPGSLVATARATLQRAKARNKFIASTGIHSPMGEIVLVQVLEYGEMEIAGASRSTDQRTVIALLKQCGADLVLLDGALGRSHHASPAIAEGVILSTGAAIGGGMGDVIRKTRDRLAILGLVQAPPTTRALCAELFNVGGVGIWARNGTQLFAEPIATLNAGATLLQFADADIGTVAVTGAVGRSLWRAVQTLADKHPGMSLVVHDGTKLFVDQLELAALQKNGSKVLAQHAIRLVGITLNHFSPFGGSFDAQEFLTTARASFEGYAVCDVQLEEQERFHD